MFFRGPLAHNTGGLTLGICHSMVLGALHTSCSTLCIRFVSPLGLRQVSQGPGHTQQSSEQWGSQLEPALDARVLGTCDCLNF